MMVKVLLYAYATGVFSSRGAGRWKRTWRSGVLAAGNFPQHRTLCEFRRRHLEDFRALFVEVVRLAQALGLARLGSCRSTGRRCVRFREQAQGDELRPDAGGGTAWQARSRRCYARRMRPTRPRTRALARRLGAMSCRRSCVGGRASGGDPGGEGAVGSGGSGGRRRAGSAAGAGPQPEGRAAVQAGVWRAGREGAEQLHGPGKLDHEDEQRGVPALQRAGGGGRRAPVGGGDGSDGERECQGELPVLLDTVKERFDRSRRRCWPTRGTATGT